MNVRKVQSSNYELVLEVKCPIRFYWTSKDKFDGVELGPFRKLTRYQAQLISVLLDRLETAMPTENEPTPEVPDAFKNAFEETR